MSLNQLVGEQFVVGTRYTLTDAELRDTLIEVPVSVLATADQKLNARLHQLTGYVLWNHPSGLFARADLQWYLQNNSGYTTPMPGDDFFRKIFLWATGLPIDVRKSGWDCSTSAGRIIGLTR